MVDEELSEFDHSIGTLRLLWLWLLSWAHTGLNKHQCRRCLGHARGMHEVGHLSGSRTLFIDASGRSSSALLQDFRLSTDFTGPPRLPILGLWWFKIAGSLNILEVSCESLVSLNCASRLSIPWSIISLSVASWSSTGDQCDNGKVSSNYRINDVLRHGIHTAGYTCKHVVNSSCMTYEIYHRRHSISSQRYALTQQEIHLQWFFIITYATLSQRTMNFRFSVGQPRNSFSLHTRMLTL